MLNIIRTHPSRDGSLSKTIANLARSSGGNAKFEVVSSDTKTANQNGLEALRVGIDLSPKKPFVFLEDDIDFIHGFDEAVDLFYRDCLGVESLILPLCANYGAVMECRGMAWKYRVGAFYGTQAFIIEPEDAKNFINWAGTPKYDQGFDIMLKEWAIESGHHYFRTPYRSFVQHIGHNSLLNPGRFHDYPSWQGREWTYQSSCFNMLEQKARPLDASLCDAIITLLNRSEWSYDVGCSSGLYTKRILDSGRHCKGFDATPGIEGEFIEELDISRIQKFLEPKGNVICLEVGEHIAKDREVAFLRNLVNLSSGRIILSWAVPGQGGNRHVNEKSREEVHSLMKKFGFWHNSKLSAFLSSAATLPWFKNSIGVYDQE